MLVMAATYPVALRATKVPFQSDLDPTTDAFVFKWNMEPTIIRFELQKCDFWTVAMTRSCRSKVFSHRGAD